MSQNNPVAAVIDTVRQQTGTIEQAATPGESTVGQTALGQQPDPKLDLYARKERQLQKMRRELEAKEQALQAKQAGYETDYVPKSKFLADPIQALAEVGVSYEQLTEMLLNQPDQNNPQIKSMLTKIRQLEEKQTAAERAQAQAVEQQFEQAKRQIATEAALLIDSDPEFETIKAQGMHDAVTELIIETFQTDGVLMDVRAAALEVENHLIEEGMKLAQLSKVQSRLKPKVDETLAPAAATAGLSKQPQQGLKTITNQVAAPSAPTRMTEKERMARAIAAFKGELK